MEGGDEDLWIQWLPPLVGSSFGLASTLPCNDLSGTRWRYGRRPAGEMKTANRKQWGSLSPPPLSLSL